MAGRKGKCPGCGNPIRIGSPKKKAPPHEHTPDSELPIRTARPKRAQPPAVPEPPEITTIEHGQLAAAPQGAPQTAVQVNVNNKSASNSLGIASIILGILTFFVCWLPPAAFSLGGLGMLLGIAGLVMSVVRKGTGIGYAIAGTAVSTVGVVLGIIFILMIQTAVEVGDQMAQIPDRIREEVEQQAEAVEDGTTTDEDSNSGDNTATTEESDADTASEEDMPTETDQETSEAEAGPEFVDASQETLRLGSIQVEVIDTRLGDVDLYNRIRRRESKSKDPAFVIWLRITNTSENKKVDYTGWMAEFASAMDIDATLTDNFGNNYRAVTYGATTGVKDATTKGSIYPGESIVDAIIFEIPVATMDYVDLVLSAKGCKEEGEFRFRIANEMIEVDD